MFRSGDSPRYRSGVRMAVEPCREALRVAGVPQEVIAWIDHDQRPHLVFLNAECFTAEQERTISAALARGNYTLLQVLDSFVKGEG